MVTNFQTPWETGESGYALRSGRDAAERGREALHRYLSEAMNRPVIECALRIRAVESSLYDLFGKGRLHGTIHTCTGQEFSGAMLGKHLRPGDFITSNHRCHGHFIAATGNWRGLIDELVGNRDGVCAGIGSSQHLWATNFLSNGQQGGLLPVAAGVALDRKTIGAGGVVFSFLGEGTLGEGILYETLNLDSLWGLPHVVICENNFYSQSTPQDRSVSGVIADRSIGFGIVPRMADTWDLAKFDTVLQEAIAQARDESRPAFVVVRTYRLNPHSKGDDNRPATEVAWFREQDAASSAVRDYSQYRELYAEYVAEAQEAIEAALQKPSLTGQEYFEDQLPRNAANSAPSWKPASTDSADLRVAQQLNAFYRDWLARDESAYFLGEDIHDPYGGAFKISKGFTDAFGARVRTTPISEAALVGVSIGLAVAGRRAFAEIMFGDFITYAFDQLVNNASKMFHMYNKKFNCPVVVRTPMGARRGYGPTHSQSLERFLIGIDNCCTASLNSLVPVAEQLSGIEKLCCPVILLENKVDYTARTYAPPPGFTVSVDDSLLPTVRVHTEGAVATVTILAYSGIARFVANGILDIFERTDAVPEIIAPVCISPLNLAPIAESVRKTGRLIIVEEGSAYGNVGAETVAALAEQLGRAFQVRRVSGKPTPIPSAPALEAAALPSIEDICLAIASMTGMEG